MRDADGGDLQIHRADAETLTLQPVKDDRRFAVEWQNRQLVQRIDTGSETCVGFELGDSCLVTADEADPALERLLGGDDAGEDLGALDR